MAENWRDFTFDNNRYLILKEKEVYFPTASGKSFHKKPDNVERKVVEPEHYQNYITSIPFFNNWGNGAYCRGVWTYTQAGYLPTSITTVGPGRCEKNIVHFRFINKDRMAEQAGWREKEVMRKAKEYEIEEYKEYYNPHYPTYGRRITFFTEDSGVTHSATWDTGKERWVD